MHDVLNSTVLRSSRNAFNDWTVQLYASRTFLAYLLTCDCSRLQYGDDEGDDDDDDILDEGVRADTSRYRRSRWSLTATTTETVELFAPTQRSRTDTHTFCRAPVLIE